MDLMKSTRLVLLVAFIVGATSVKAGFEDATKLQDCLQALKDVMDPYSPCEHIPAYVKCAVRTTGLMKSLTSTELIQEAETGLETGLRSGGLDCPVDLAKIVDELRAEGNTEVATRDPSQPLTLENANTEQECLEALGKPRVTCSDAPGLVRCQIRTAGILHFLTTSEATQRYARTLEQTLENIGLYNCDLDVLEIVNDLKGQTKTEGQGSSNSFEEGSSNSDDNRNGGLTTMNCFSTAIMTFVTVFSMFIVYIL